MWQETGQIQGRLHVPAARARDGREWLTVVVTEGSQDTETKDLMRMAQGVRPSHTQEHCSLLEQDTSVLPTWVSRNPLGRCRRARPSSRTGACRACRSLGPRLLGSLPLTKPHREAQPPDVQSAKGARYPACQSGRVC